MVSDDLRAGVAQLLVAAIVIGMALREHEIANRAGMDRVVVGSDRRRISWTGRVDDQTFAARTHQHAARRGKRALSDMDGVRYRNDRRSAFGETARSFRD